MIFVKLKGSWKEPLMYPSRQRSPLTIHRYLRSKPTNAPSLYDFICITDIIVTPFCSSRFSTLLCYYTRINFSLSAMTSLLSHEHS